MTHEESRKRRAEIVAYRKEHSVRETADHFGLTYNYVVQIAGNTGGRNVQDLGIRTYQLIALLINTDTDLGTLAEQLKLSSSRIHDIYKTCVESGIPVKQRGFKYVPSTSQ